jgi:hypothetical protein
VESGDRKAASGDRRAETEEDIDRSKVFFVYMSL